jgi:hypothetical protein
LAQVDDLAASAAESTRARKPPGVPFVLVVVGLPAPCHQLTRRPSLSVDQRDQLPQLLPVSLLGSTLNTLLSAGACFAADFFAVMLALLGLTE